MILNTQQIILLVLILLFILKKIFSGQPIVRKYDLYISILLLGGLVILIAVDFWSKNILIGIIALLLGSGAILKILFDTTKRD